jgi:dihydrofolate reductase
MTTLTPAVPALALIAAVTRNGIIGNDGGMPWHIPGDLAHFKETTRGSPIVMGRRTWESLGRPLPHRRNIVVTSNPVAQFTGAEAVKSLAAALALCEGEPLVFCIGGAVLYQEALRHAKYMYLTEIHAYIEGDTRFPDVNWAEWQEEDRQFAEQSEHPRAFDFVRYKRKTG